MLSKINNKQLLFETVKICNYLTHTKLVATESISQNLQNQKIPTTTTTTTNKTTDDGDNNAEWKQAKSFNDIPGPGVFKMIKRLLPGGKYNGLSLKQLNQSIRDEYGDITKFRGIFGRADTVMVFDPSDFEIVFRTEGIWPHRQGFVTFAHYRQKIRGDIFKDNGGLLTEHGENWQNTRTKVNPVMLPPKIVNMYIPHVDEVVKDFIDRIKPMRDQNMELPGTFGEEINKWSLESIGFIALDQRLGVFDEERNPEAKRIISAVRVILTLATEFEVIPPIWKYYQTVKFKQLMTAFDDMTKSIMSYIDVAVRRIDEQQTKKADHELGVLEKLLKIDRHVAIVMAADMLMAGIDTTSTATINCLYHLAKNPDKQEILRKEILQTLPDRNTKFSSNSLNNLPYLRACFKEAMRLSPVVPGNGRAAGKNIVLKGYQIPKGTEIGMGSVIIQRETNHFKLPDEFLPERWLKETTNTMIPVGTDGRTCPMHEINVKQNTHPFVYLPFGFGSRSCIGRRFAEMEFQVLVSRLLQNFKISWNYEPLKYSNGLVMAPEGPLKFQLTDI